MMENTLLLASGGMGGHGGRTPRGGRGKAFFKKPLGSEGSRMMSPCRHWRHSETQGDMIQTQVLVSQSIREITATEGKKTGSKTNTTLK